MFTPFAFVKTLAPAIPTYSYLLDDYSGAYAAFSLRKLSSTYNGSAIQVRRSNDNATQDIGFVNNVLDTGSLLDFCGANNGFVTYWYDQSGNARDLAGTSNAFQPRIVNAGTLETSNSKPAISFSSAHWMEYDIVDTFNYPTSYFTVLSPVNNTTPSYYGMVNTGDNENFMIVGNNGTSQTISAWGDDGGAQTPFNGLSTTNGTQYLATNINFSQTNTGRKLYVNSTNEYTSTVTVFEQVCQYISLNRYDRRSTAGLGSAKWTEIIHYMTNQTGSRSGIESNINNYYSIY